MAATKVLAQKAMFEQSAKQSHQPTEVVAASLNERQKELEMLRSRWDKQKQMAVKPVATQQEQAKPVSSRPRWEVEPKLHAEVWVQK